MASLIKPKPPSPFTLHSLRLFLSPLSTSSSPLDPIPKSAAGFKTDGDTNTTSAAVAVATAATLTPSETKLLDNLYSLIRDHHRTNPNPNPSSTPSPDLTIPSLSVSFSHLSPSPPSPVLARSLIDRCGSLRHGVPFHQTLAFFNWWLSSSSSSSPSAVDLAPAFTEMIDLAGKLGHFTIAWCLLDSLKSREVPIPFAAFSALIRRYVRAGDPSSAAAAFHRMPDYGLSPDPSSVSSLIGALSKKRLAAEAQSLFDALRTKLPPDVFTYSALVHAWCRSGRLDEAERVFTEMRDSKISPNVYTYTAIIDAMCRANQIPRAHELLCQMLHEGCPPNTATFNSFMRAHVKAGRTELALQVHNQMRELSCEPDVITYNFLVEAHCRHGQKNLDAALKVLNQMQAKGCAPNASSFNPIFRHILELGDVGAAHRLYTRMRELGCPPNTVTYNLLMQLFRKEKSIDMVLRMKKEMDKDGVEPNVNTYGVLISEFCGRGNWRRAYGLMLEMVEEKCLKPTMTVYELVMTLLRRAGQLTKHDELLEKMVERGFITRRMGEAAHEA